MKVLLVYPQGNRELIGWGDLGAIAEPLALEYIGAGAKIDKHEVLLLDMRLHPDSLEAMLMTFQPDVVGVTGYSMHVLRNLDICRRTKFILPGCQTIVGGHHATLLPQDFFEPVVDYVVGGEGVAPFRAILSCLEQQQPVQQIPGVWSRVNGTFVSGGEPQPLDIDSIPPPDRTLTAADRSRYFIDWMKPIALLRTTVGCPYRCSFCSLWRIMGGRYYRRDVLRVIDELRTIEEPYVFLVDDEPFVNSKRMDELADCIAQAGIQKQYFSYCRIDSFLKDRALMEKWHAIGLRRVFFGLETIFDDELKDYNKRQQRDDIIEALNVAREIGISVFANFIISPEYTAHELEQIVKFIKEYDVEYPSFTILTPIPGTPAGDDIEKILFRQPNGRPNWDYFDLQHPVTATRLPYDEFMREYRNLYRVFAPAYQEAAHPFYNAPLPKATELHQGPPPPSAGAIAAVAAAVPFVRELNVLQSKEK